MDFEGILDVADAQEAFIKPIQTNVLSRWERSQNEKARDFSTPKSNLIQNSLNKTPSIFGSSKKTPYHKKPNKTPSSDRFIPNKVNSDLLFLKSSEDNTSSPSTKDFKECLADSLLTGQYSSSSKILAFKEKAPKPTLAHQNNLRVLYTCNKENTSINKKKFRHVNTAPERILDAPNMVDDFYLNLLDWSVQNILAVALGSSVYLWHANTGKIDVLFEGKQDDEIVTSLSWMSDGTVLAVGTSNNDVQLWDLNCKQLRLMKGHLAQVGSLAWNQHLLSSGSRDSMIFHHDVRVANHHLATLTGHKQEICGLKWSPDGTQIASGGNDNLCCVYDISGTTPLHIFDQHMAAVKALSWCPWEKNLLATGGGTADRHIRFFNTQTGSMLQNIDTKSQVCALLWNPYDRELCSAHGFSHNQLTLWKYPSMARMAELTGHTSRVLHLTLSPDCTTACSAAADETLRFWKIFEGPIHSSSHQRDKFNVMMKNQLR